MLNKKYIPFLLLILSFSSWCFAQSEIIQFKVYGFEEGLTHRNTFKVQQDPMGYIWIATIKGLNKFDGMQFFHYTQDSKENHIPNNYISDFVISKDTLIYLADASGLVLLDPRNNEVKRIKTDSLSHLFKKEKNLSNLYVDKNNNISANVYDKRNLNAFIQRTSKDQNLHDFLECKGNYINMPVIQLNGDYFLGVFENELWQVDEHANIKERFTFSFPEPDPSFSRIIQLQVTKDETLWVLLDNGQVYSLKKDAKTFQKHNITNSIYNKGISSSFLVEDNGDIWVGGIGNLWYFNALENTCIDYNSTVKQILDHNCKYRHFFKDDAGVIWVATNFGVVKIAKSEKLFTHYLSNGSPNCSGGFCSTRGITGDEDGKLYISYYSSIHVLDTKIDSLYPLFQKSVFFNTPFGLLYHNNALWTGNGKRIDLKTKEVEHLIDQTDTELGMAMLDFENEIWFGLKNKFYQYDTLTKQMIPYQVNLALLDTAKMDISFMYQGKTNHYIWASTIGDGLYKIDKTKGVLAHYNTAKKSRVRLKHNKINGTYEDGFGNLWIATGKGLHKLNIATEQLKIYTTKDGLPNDFINGILSEGDSCIWVSTDNGLSRFQMESEIFSNFYDKDGLSKNEFNRISAYQSEDGRMYFGGLSGVNAFYPNTRFTKPKLSYEAKLLFTSFSKYDGNFDSLITQTSGLSGLEEIELSHRDKFFTFHFALANYKNPHENKYAYLLEGFESKWSKPSSDNSARYNNIPPGNYTFRVKASSPKGSWSENQLAIKVSIKEAFYKTKTFFLTSLLFMLGLFYLAFRYRIYNIRKRRDFLERKVKERTLELEREKNKSDDLLLNILPAEMADELKAFGKVKAKRYNAVTVLFTDFKNFTKISQTLEPEQLVAEIDYCFKNYDRIIEKYNLEKIKTIGDSYMCAAGIPNEEALSAVKIVMAALEIQTFMHGLKNEKSAKKESFFEARIGLHSGTVVGGIVGIKKFAFDIWGDTVNVASRMENSGQVGKVNISDSTYQLIKNDFVCIPRGKITVKNKGEIDMYFVERLKV